MEDWNYNFWGPGFGLWGFILLIILITSFFGYLRARSRNELIREALRSGQEIDPQLFREIGEEDGAGGPLTGGFVTLAVALGIIVLGYQISNVSGEEEVFEVMKGAAAIPGFIGIALIIVGTIRGIFSRRQK
ncbi:MAG: DUF6249 domain-containing protein [Pseudomonadota bacterium]